MKTRNATDEELKEWDLRVEDEKVFRSGAKSLDATCQNHLQLLNNTVTALEARTKDLQKRRRDIDETHENNIQQVEAFSNLRKLLELKEKILRSETGATGGQSATTIDQDLKSLNQKTQQGGADIFVV